MNHLRTCQVYTEVHTLRYRAKPDLYRKSFDWFTELASIRIQLPLFIVSSFYLDFILPFFFCPPNLEFHPI